MYEITPYIRNIHLRSKEGWEQARLGAYITAQVNSTKKLKITDIMEFPWEATAKSKKMQTGVKEISNEDVNRLRNKAKQYLNNGQI